MTGLLVFAEAVGGAGTFLAKLVAPYLCDVLAAEERFDGVRIWWEWLVGRGFGDVEGRFVNGSSSMRAVVSN